MHYVISLHLVNVVSVFAYHTWSISVANNASSSRFCLGRFSSILAYKLATWNIVLWLEYFSSLCYSYVS